MESNKIRVAPKGLGDTLKEIFDATGVSIVFKKATRALNVEDCGCSKRQEQLNKLFPYRENKQIDIGQDCP